MFYGDSRLRFSFAEWIRMANGSVEDPYFPQNAPCPAHWNHSQCAEWHKGRECGTVHGAATPCLRDWHPTSSKKSGRWTFIALLTEGAFTSLVTSSQQPDLVVVNEGAWAIYGMQKRNEPNQPMDYFRILQNVIENMRSIDQRVQKRNTIKVWMAYPECPQSVWRGHGKKINDLMEEYIQDRDDWILFRLPTPNLPKMCEGFHVRDEWTKVENEILASALCEF